MQPHFKYIAVDSYSPSILSETTPTVLLQFLYYCLTFPKIFQVSLVHKSLPDL